MKRAVTGMVRARSGAFTLIELIAVLCVIAVLAGVLADRLMTYQERAEKTAMEQVVVVLKTALQLRSTGMLVHGRLADLKELETENPMNWLAERPENYLGAYAEAPSSDISAGKWYFDIRERQLVYVPARSRNFLPGRNGKTAIRFRVLIDVGPLPGEVGRPNPMVGIGKIEFAATEPYNWFRDIE